MSSLAMPEIQGGNPPSHPVMPESFNRESTFLNTSGPRLKNCRGDDLPPAVMPEFRRESKRLLKTVDARLEDCRGDEGGGIHVFAFSFWNHRSIPSHYLDS